MRVHWSIGIVKKQTENVLRLLTIRIILAYKLALVLTPLGG